MCRSIVLSATIATVVFAVTLAPRDADGCAAVRRPTEPTIRIAEESAIIVWDSAKKVQHFIRRAAFDTPSADFGFLVPTPSAPVMPMAEVEDQIFRDVDRWILPRVVDRAELNTSSLLCSPFFAMRGEKKAAEKEGRSGVRVLGEQTVGGFKAAILEADSATALSDWLKEHGYSNDPELQSWLAPYVAAKWKITAFKITQDPKSGKLATTKAVRMSFSADRPFFPYREPEPKPTTDAEKKPAEEKREKEKGPRPFHFDEKGEKVWNDARLLRVVFVSDMRMEGKLGNKAWHAKVPWADHLTEEQIKSLERETSVPAGAIPANAWLTVFEDHADPRPAFDEVYFDVAKDQSPIRPPDFVRYYDVWIPIDLVIIGLIVVGFVAYRILKRRDPEAQG
ncbi:MAG: DUF2330 domain-containing protein [Planctomycetes bacterium]|nr:DUF2330 domain-containing protein [Planctomycetota bacterium]